MKQYLYQLKNICAYPYYKITHIKTFRYKNRVLYEYIHWYNHTWDNCRRYEIPIFSLLVEKYQRKHILEVGNVLKHYFPLLNHDVVDKYEKMDDVINEDIICFKPKTRYDVVLSCSTLEHVGFDEPVKDKDGFRKAVDNIMSNVLVKNGVLFFSVPLGYNPSVDFILDSQCFLFDDIVFFFDADWRVGIYKLVKR